MIEAKKKLKKVHIDLWGPHYLLLLSEKTYAAILLDTKIRKSWIIYLQSKDEFIDAFVTWVSKVKNEYNKLVKVL